MSKATARVLEDALALLAGGARWRKANDEDFLLEENNCALTCVGVTEWGLFGKEAAFLALARAVGGNKKWDVATWNDAPERAWPEVEEVFKRAIAAERAS